MRVVDAERTIALAWLLPPSAELAVPAQLPGGWDPAAWSLLAKKAAAMAWQVAHVDGSSRCHVLMICMQGGGTHACRHQIKYAQAG